MATRRKRAPVKKARRRPDTHQAMIDLITGYWPSQLVFVAAQLVVEHVLRPGNARDWGKLLDINMLVVPGGQERAREEFRDLFARAGLTLRRVLPTASPLSLLEAVPA